jgi:hypothetical protein
VNRVYRSGLGWSSAASLEQPARQSSGPVGPG